MPQMAEADLIAAVNPANAGNMLSNENDPVAIASNTCRHTYAVNIIKALMHPYIQSTLLNPTPTFMK